MHYAYSVSFKVGNGVWKPIQTGIILATNNVISLSERILREGVAFLLTSRLTQDCLENLFSTVRKGNPIPTAIEFQKHLKIITIAQYLRTPKSGSYLDDDSTYLADYLEKVPAAEPVPESADAIVVIAEKEDEELGLPELNSLYYLAGEANGVIYPVSC